MTTITPTNNADVDNLIDSMAFPSTVYTGQAQTSTAFGIMQTGAFAIVFRGAGFTGYDASGFPTGGTITSIENYVIDGVDGILSNTWAGFAPISVANFRTWMNTNNVSALLNALFGGGDAITGSNNHDDNLHGYSGNDVIDGRQGLDEMYGGNGNDRIIARDSDSIWGEVFDGGAGTDTLHVFGDVDFTEASVFSFEKLVFAADPDGGSAWFHTAQLGSGISNTLALTGVHGQHDVVYLVNSAASSINLSGWTFSTWNASEDQIIITGSGVAESFTGSSMRDTVSYDNSASGVTASLVNQASNEGDAAGDTYANIENLQGTEFNDTLTGNSGANFLIGGFGIDTLIGGAGDDTYLVEGDVDSIVEQSGGGTDTVISLGDFTLGANLEHLTLLTGLFDVPVHANGTGNSLNNTITGNEENNILDGDSGNDTLIGGDGNDRLIGNSGADAMTGGAGHDSYYVDHAGDTTVEIAYGGLDTVRSSINWQISNYIENLILTGSANINGTGNGGGNIITGNSGANILDGKASGDSLIGGLGDDIYVVDHVGDVITENVGEGIDSVRAYNNYTLAANVENLTMVGSSANGGGNALNNTIRGNGLNNVISGGDGDDLLLGGLGNDRLTGGGGADAFIFNTTPNNTTNRDQIVDFSVADDTIRLDNAVFASLGANGVLNAAFFRIGTAAADGNHYIIYNSAAGALFYDADGNGAGTAIRFATISTGLAMTNADFLVI